MQLEIRAYHVLPGAPLSRVQQQAKRQGLTPAPPLTLGRLVPELFAHLTHAYQMPRSTRFLYCSLLRPCQKAQPHSAAHHCLSRGPSCSCSKGIFGQHSSTNSSCTCTFKANRQGHLPGHMLQGKLTDAPVTQPSNSSYCCSIATATAAAVH